MTLRITGRDVEHYISVARERFDKEVLAAREYELLADEAAESGRHFAAGAYYALALLRSLPDLDEAQRLAELAAGMLRHTALEDLLLDRRDHGGDRDRD